MKNKFEMGSGSGVDAGVMEATETSPEADIEAGQNHEGAEKISSKIAMKFFRHDEKESAIPGEPAKPDEEVRLTQKGRIHAKAQATLENIRQAVAFGSPRKRAQETAALHMAGAQDNITGLEDLDELKYKLTPVPAVEGVTVGSKLMVDQRLNFILEGDSEYSKAANKAFTEGRLMKFLVEESDVLATETGDVVNSTYTKMAASIASVVEKYLMIAPRFDKLVETSPKGYENEMQRFFGTHQSIGESFLAKIIEKTDGVEERDRFVKALKNKGFGFSEGFEIDIVTPENGGEAKIHVSYKKDAEEKNGEVVNEGFLIDKDVPLELVHEIAEGK